MDIEDILKRKEFKKLDKFLDDEMEKYAGPKLIDQMYDVFGKENARDWFYSKVYGLGGKRPYDFCKKGDKKEVKDLLGRIEYGVFA